jgi:hypothetical protein
MFNILILSILSSFSIAQAQSLVPASGGVTLSKNTVTLSVDISAENVKLSRADYSVPVVKVLIPELADVTILDHRNTGEGAPCMATYDTNVPEDVVQGTPEVIQVEFEITLIKNTYPNEANGTCSVFLREHIEGTIRGHKFVHLQEVLIGERHLDDCR